MKLQWNILYKYGWDKQKNIQKNGAETIVDNEILRLRLNDHIKEGLAYKNLQITTGKYSEDYRKHGYELVDEPKKQFNRIHRDKELVIKVHKFST